MTDPTSILSRLGRSNKPGNTMTSSRRIRLWTRLAALVCGLAVVTRVGLTIVGTSKPESLYKFLQRILYENNVDFIQAPYSAAAQVCVAVGYSDYANAKIASLPTLPKATTRSLTLSLDPRKLSSSISIS